jgi:hypothetical protein
MDDYEGVNSQPATLHKYLYAHADPVNGIDPSGRFTLVERLAVASAVAILAIAQTSFLPYHRNGQPIAGGFGSQEAGDDVTAGIVQLLDRVDAYYGSLSISERRIMARNLLHPEQANGMWDINPLSLIKLNLQGRKPFPGLRIGAGPMDGTVTFMRRPVYAVSLNYILFGRLMGLIHEDRDIGIQRHFYSSDTITAAVFFRQDIQLAMVQGSQPLLTYEPAEQALDFAMLGYFRGYSTTGSPPYLRLTTLDRIGRASDQVSTADFSAAVNLHVVE